jgi:UDP-2,3-diacylglucosamine hydrolase
MQTINTEKTILFASDFHLGIPNYKDSKKRELILIDWLTKYEYNLEAIYFLGDVFDFWFEYKTVVPRGYTRLLGKLALLSDKGVKLTFFKGNHDMWMFDYFEKELGATIISNELLVNINGKKVFMHHGDGLGPGDNSYKLLKGFFRSQICQWLFARLHPNFGLSIANYFSRKSRLANGVILPYQGDEKEALWNYIKTLDNSLYADFYLCGHRHLPLEKILPSGAKYINTGDWFQHFSYAAMNGTQIELKYNNAY